MSNDKNIYSQSPGVKPKWDSKLPYFITALPGQRSFPVPAHARLEELNRDIAEITAILDEKKAEIASIERILVQKRYERDGYVKRHVG